MSHDMCLCWQQITKEIRKLLDVEDISWNRSIMLPPREQKGINVLLTYWFHYGNKIKEPAANCNVTVWLT